MKITQNYLLAAYTVLLGALACVGWLFIGQSDDAPGAGMIGFAALLSSFFAAYRIARMATAKRQLQQIGVLQLKP
ncbi:hypothetical protein [Sphingomonas glaciei]|uniref:Lipoprotein n=1 Tax=Sphingomonas glaciei TaxID=2938948 RepID=A0ABY5MY19_9SPHN|nr:hypothetical protein [Sphingomonas glaciei]UUR09355.1 hypothetical protein M1K48_07015 [Sphingomonas glaciei]